MTTSVRLVDGATTIWLRPAVPTAADPIICQTHEITPPAPRVVAQQRVGRSGMDDLTQFHDGALFKASLTVQDAGGQSRHQTIDALRALTYPSRRPYLYIQRDGWLSERRALLRGDPLTSVIDRLAGQRVLVSLQFAIPDGVLVDPVQKTTILRPSGTSTGMSFPMSYPLTFAALTSGSTTIITLPGSAPSAPLLRLYGMATDPVIRNLTTGKTIELDNITIPAGSYLEIDVANRTVLMNGDPALSYYNRVNFTTTDWWELQPGDNTVTVSATANDATAELDPSWFDQWIAG